MHVKPGGVCLASRNSTTEASLCGSCVAETQRSGVDGRSTRQKRLHAFYGMRLSTRTFSSSNAQIRASIIRPYIMYSCKYITVVVLVVLYCGDEAIPQKKAIHYVACNYDKVVCHDAKFLHHRKNCGKIRLNSRYVRSGIVFFPDSFKARLALQLPSTVDVKEKAALSKASLPLPGLKNVTDSRERENVAKPMDCTVNGVHGPILGE